MTQEITHIDVGYNVLDYDKVVDLVTHQSAGAISTFIGTTRDNFEGAYCMNMVNFRESLTVECRQKSRTLRI